MKKEQINVRLSIRRLNKLRELAAERDKTMTQLIEEWIDAAVAESNRGKTEV